MDNEAMKFLHWYFKELSFDLGQSLIRVRTLAMNENKGVYDPEQAQRDIDESQRLTKIARDCLPIVDDSLSDIGFDKSLRDFDESDKKTFIGLIK